MEPQPEKDSFFSWNVAIFGIWNRWAAALRPRKLDRFDRSGVDHEPPDFFCKPAAEHRNKVSLYCPEGLAAPVIPIAGYKLRKQVKIVLLNKSVEAALRVVRQGFLHEGKRQYLAIGKLNPPVLRPPSHGGGDVLLIQVVKKAVQKQKHVFERKGSLVHNSRLSGWREKLRRAYLSANRAPAVPF